MDLIKRVVLALLFAVPLWGQNPQTHDVNNTEPLFHTNAAWVNGIGQGYWPQAHEKPSTTLILNIGVGTSNCPAGTIVSYVGGTLTLTDNTTNYVYLDTASSCAPGFNTSGFTSSLIPIAVVVTSGGVITTITDDRTMFVPSGGLPTHNCATHQFVNSTTSPSTIVCAQPADADIAFTNITTGDATTSQHGFAPKGTGAATDCYLGTSVFGACPSGAGTISGLTTNYVPKAGGATSITANSAMDDGVTTAGVMTVTSKDLAVAVPASGSTSSPAVKWVDSVSGIKHLWASSGDATGFWGLSYDTSVLLKDSTTGTLSLSSDGSHFLTFAESSTGALTITDNVSAATGMTFAAGGAKPYIFGGSGGAFLTSNGTPQNFQTNHQWGLPGGSTWNHETSTTAVGWGSIINDGCFEAWGLLSSDGATTAPADANSTLKTCRGSTGSITTAHGALVTDSNPQSIGSSTTATLDLRKGNLQQVACTGAGGFAITLATSNLTKGQTIHFVFVQNATSACTVAAAASMHGLGTVSVTLSSVSVQDFIISNNGTDMYAVTAMQSNTGGTP